MRYWYKTLIAAMVMAAVSTANAETSVNTTNKWAWSASGGWFNCRPDSTNGMVIGEYYCSGYWYSPSAGWISVGDGTPSNGVNYANDSSTDYGVNHDGSGHLTGYAWSPSFGWIDFGWTNNPDAANAPKVDLKTGLLSGYVWGGSLGWISLSNNSGRLQTDWMISGTNSDNDGLADAWELAQTGGTNLGLLSAAGDYDRDGVSDGDEYVADTSPTNKEDFLEFTGLWVSDANVNLRWNSRMARLYRIQKKNSLFDASWADSGLGLIEADSDTNTVKAIPTSTQGFYRVRAVLPLAK